LRERKSELVVGRVLSADPDPDITAESLFYEQHVVVTKPPNKWLKRRKITLAELVNEPWILSPLEVQPGTPVVEAFRAFGLDPPKALIVSNSLNLRNNLLATGRFVTVVPGSVLRFVPEYLLFKVLPLKLPIATFPTAILTLKNRMLSPMAELFIECVRELAQPLAQEMRHNRPVRRWVLFGVQIWEPIDSDEWAKVFLRFVADGKTDVCKRGWAASSAGPSVVSWGTIDCNHRAARVEGLQQAYLSAAWAHSHLLKSSQWSWGTLSIRSKLSSNPADLTFFASRFDPDQSRICRLGHVERKRQ
jgi:LysR substrate binding domain